MPTSIFDRVPLNQVQKDAVACDQWPQLVFAGAGTGKTRVLTAKIAWLIESCGAVPSRIFAATFTNKAAQEMRSRVESLVGTTCDGMWIGTFHSLCARILRREARHLGFTQSFTIYDRDDQISCMRTVIKELGIDERTVQPQHAVSFVSNQKNLCVPASRFSENAAGFFQQEMAKIYSLYQSRLQRLNAMDFDDLITNTVYMLRDHPDVLEAYRERFKYVLVDEYQDTNASQLHLVRLLGGGHGRIFVVGDDDQSIYGWRGAQIENILSFEKHFPQSAVFKLEQNYRSPSTVLQFANAVIAHNNRRADKKLWTTGNGGTDVAVVRFSDDRREAEGIVDKACRMSAGGMKLGSMAVLFRTNAQSRAFEDILRRRKVPYRLVGGLSFYERKEIKDCLAYLRLLVNARDDVACDRILNVPARGIGAKSRDTLIDRARASNRSMLETILAGEWGDVSSKARKGFGELQELFTHLTEMVTSSRRPSDILDEMLTLSGYTDELEGADTEEASARLDNINELMNGVTFWSQENSGRTLADFIEEVTLVSDVDRWDPNTDALNLMTLHCAKGLEFKAVFLAGVEDGLLPSRQNFDDPEKLEEERRLLYVGCTRAMEVLQCSYVDQRWRFGSLMPMGPSRFLRAVSADLYHEEDTTRIRFEQPRVPAAKPKTPYGKPIQAPVRQVQRPPQPASHDEYSQVEVQYRMGQQVNHRLYGRGKILSVSGFGPDIRLTILFQDGSRKKIMARFANLETI